MAAQSQVGPVQQPPSTRPVMLYDADCHFCQKWIMRWQALTQGTIDFLPYQEHRASYPEIPVEACENSVQLIERDGRVYGGAEAVFRALSGLKPWKWLYQAYVQFPCFARLSESTYAFIAAHRYFFSILTKLLWGRSVLPPTYRFSSWLFLRLLGVVSFIAFASFWTQASGLVGPDGIYPISAHLDQLGNVFGEDRLWKAPSLFWAASPESLLFPVLITGMVVSAFLTLGLLPPLTLLLVWTLYLSLCTAVPVFLNFQWDSLLIETAFMAFWMAPWVWRHRGQSRLPEPSWIGRLLLWWLLFRLMFESGMVKVTSPGSDGVNTWLNLTALDYHYWTQPLPTWTSWLLAKLPHWFQALSVIVMFIVELVLPFLIWGPRRLRMIACGGIALFQVLILASGNYGFFNLLALALCVMLVDDQSLPDWLVRRLDSRPTATPVSGAARALGWVRVPVALLVLAVSGIQLLQTMNWIRLRPAGPEKAGGMKNVQFAMSKVRPFRSINSYGLFQVMTTERPEILIEGRREGGEWKSYDFKWKPDELTERPRIIIPHMPRLDWQMWFAALRPDFRHTQQRWFSRFLRALLENRPAVTKLLAENPFPDHAPDWIRATKYHYRFTDFQTWRKTGRWWEREKVGPYTPAIPRRAMKQNP